MIPEEDTNQPGLYIVGADMLQDRLDQFVKEIEAANEDHFRVKYVDINSPDGAQFCETLEIDAAQLPAVLILEDDESVYKDWYGQDLPEVETVIYEMSQLTGSSEA